MDTGKMTSGRAFQGLPWWVVSSAGIASVGLGILLLISPTTALAALVRIVGWVGIVGGGAAILSILFDRAAWGWKLFGGSLSILVGMILASQPQASAYLVSAIVIFMLGTAFLLTGIVLLIMGIAIYAWARAVLGALIAAAGALLIFTVALSALLAPWLFAIAAVAGGALTIVQAVRMRAHGRAVPARS